LKREGTAHFRLFPLFLIFNFQTLQKGESFMRGIVHNFKFIVNLIALIVLFAAGTFAQTKPLLWQANLSAVGGDVSNVVNNGYGLTLGDENVRQSVYGEQRGYGIYTLPVETLSQAVNRIRAVRKAKVPAGAELLIEVRVRAIGGAWSEWIATTAKSPALLPQLGEEVQARLTFIDDGAGNKPVLRGLRFDADAVDQPAEEKTPQTQAAVAAPLTYKIFATREGLVGGTTANGHVIQTNDRFVALPSRRGLSSNGGTEYSVRLYYPKTGKTATVPVWDVGPWNTHDDYWNTPSVREMWRDLPQGKPEAFAAKLEGYNGGKDEFGRTVISPNGIDIADGTFWYDLGMTDNDYVEVTYLWTTGGTTWETIVDNETTGRFAASANWSTSSYSSQRYGTNYRYATPQAVSDAAWFKVSIPAVANYEVYVWYPASTGYNSSTPFIVATSSGNQTVRVNQQINGGTWVSLGIFNLNAGDYNAVGVSRWTSTAGYVIADAVRIVRR
jgi:hypothetical protein